MSDTNLIQDEKPIISSNVEVPFRVEEWYASASFGEAFQRSIYLLRHEFRFLILVFFLGGFTLSLILIPVNSMIASAEILITNELFAPIPDLISIFDLLIASAIWGLVQKFVVFFGTFVLGTIAIHHVFKTVPSLRVIASEMNEIRFPLGSTIVAAFVTSMILTLVSVIPIIVPFIQVLFFFLPLLLVLGTFPFTQAFSLSIGFRVKHWIRILSTHVTGYLLILFAGVLGLTIYLNIEVVLSLYGISLGFIGPVLLSFLTQVPVAMVAPLVPLFSVAFFAGARGAYREKQHQQFMSRQHQPSRYRYIPLDGTMQGNRNLCQYCGNPLKPHLVFCTQCGQPTKD